MVRQWWVSTGSRDLVRGEMGQVWQTQIWGEKKNSENK